MYSVYETVALKVKVVDNASSHIQPAIPNYITRHQAAL